MTANTDALDLQGMTKEEAIQYDRQIRLWGMEGQQRMRKANLLIKGIHAVTHELLKNLVLAGFGAICVWLGEEEDVVIREEALGAAFLFRADAYAATAHRSSSSENTATTPSEGHRPQPDEAVVGMRKVDVLLEKAGALNPRVKLWHVTTHDVLHYNASVSGEARAVNDTVAATGEAAFLASFDVVMILNEPLAEQMRLNDLCRKAENKTCFLSLNQFGFYACLFSDVGDTHAYVEEVVEPQAQDTDKDSLPVTTLKSRLLRHGLSLRQAQETANWSDVTRLARLKRTLSPLCLTLQGEIPFFSADADPNDVLDALQGHVDAWKRDHGVSAALAVDRETLLRPFCQGAVYDGLAPMTGIIAGILAQEVIKLVQARDAPLQNFCCFAVPPFHGAPIAGPGGVEALVHYLGPEPPLTDDMKRDHGGGAVTMTVDVEVVEL